MKKILVWITALVALVGFFDATYLTAEHYLGGTPPCFITTGCEEVTTSTYSTLGGVPIALFGVIYYLALFVLAIQNADSASERALKVLIVLSGAGFLASAYLVYVQIFVLTAICSYCMISAVSSTTIFVLSLIINNIEKNAHKLRGVSI